VQREIEMMSEPSHRYVLPIIDDDCSNSLIVILPFAHCGTLRSFVDKNPMAEMLLAVCFFEIVNNDWFAPALEIDAKKIKEDLHWGNAVGTSGGR
jgi:hypothetical protein